MAKQGGVTGGLASVPTGSKGKNSKGGSASGTGGPFGGVTGGIAHDMHPIGVGLGPHGPKSGLSAPHVAAGTIAGGAGRNKKGK